MKRDMNLIRAILLRIEAGEEPKAIPGSTESEVLYHCSLAIEAGLLKGSVIPDMSGRPISVMIQRLTWEGHDFLDTARNEKNWKKATERVAKAGGAWTFDLLKQVLVEIAKAGLGI